jgi:hypothetical protein
MVLPPVSWAAVAARMTSRTCAGVVGEISLRGEMRHEFDAA